MNQREHQINGFLIDENVPYKIKPVLAEVFGAHLRLIHASELGQQMTDLALWEYARAESLVILTKDADFVDQMFLSDAPPPWVIQVRCGNLRLKALREWLAERLPLARELLPQNRLVSVFADRIEALERQD